MLRFARITLTVLNVANWVVGILLIVALAYFGMIQPERAASAAIKTHPELLADDVVLAFRLTLLAVPIMILIVHKLLTSLAAIMDSIPAGNVFSVLNAGRLRIMAWMMIALSALDDALGMALLRLVGPYTGWSFTLTGWLTALMLFVLAMVWQQGAELRADLEGTV